MTSVKRFTRLEEFLEAVAQTGRKIIFANSQGRTEPRRDEAGGWRMTPMVAFTYSAFGEDCILYYHDVLPWHSTNTVGGDRTKFMPFYAASFGITIAPGELELTPEIIKQIKRCF